MMRPLTKVSSAACKKLENMGIVDTVLQWAKAKAVIFQPASTFMWQWIAGICRELHWTLSMIFPALQESIDMKKKMKATGKSARITGLPKLEACYWHQLIRAMVIFLRSQYLLRCMDSLMISVWECFPFFPRMLILLARKTPSSVLWFWRKETAGKLSSKGYRLWASLIVFISGLSDQGMPPWWITGKRGLLTLSEKLRSRQYNVTIV